MLIKTAKSLNHNEFYSNPRTVSYLLYFFNMPTLLRYEDFYQQNMCNGSMENVRTEVVSMIFQDFNSGLVLSSLNVKMGREI